MLKKLSALMGGGKTRKFKDVTLKRAFRSVSGENIYIWPETSPLPLERMAEMMKILELIGCNIDGETFTAYVDEINELAPKAFNDPKSAGRLAALGQTLSMRRTAFPHRDLLLNYCAIWLILENENPFVFDPEIHQQKINMFTADCRQQGSYFFFAMTGLGYISKWLGSSEESFKELLISSEIRKAKLNEMLTFLRTQ
jgi:hypothetical protein